MTDRIRLEDYGFPGDTITADRTAHGVQIHCECMEKNTKGIVESFDETVIGLTNLQARELAEWILAVVK